MFISTRRYILLTTSALGASRSHRQHEVAQLHRLLNHVESWYNCAIACEVLDLKRIKKITKTDQVVQFVKMQNQPAFVFLVNKN
jgi:hypothetical protein